VATNKIIAGGVAAAMAVLAATVPIIAPSEDASALVAYQAQCNYAHAWFDKYIVDKSNGAIRITDGEAWRPQITALAYAKQGIGIANSLHIQRLARDKNFILNGKYTGNPADYKEAGEIWEAIGPSFGLDTAWGGRFNDANHFSCAWKGVK
jgi:hypothetical protein